LQIVIFKILYRIRNKDGLYFSYETKNQFDVISLLYLNDSLAKYVRDLSPLMVRLCRKFRLVISYAVECSCKTNSRIESQHHMDGIIQQISELCNNTIHMDFWKHSMRR